MAKRPFFSSFFSFIDVASPWTMGNFGDNSPENKNSDDNHFRYITKLKNKPLIQIGGPILLGGPPSKTLFSQKVHKYKTSLHWQKFPFSQLKSLAFICLRYEVFAHRWQHLTFVWRCEWWWILTLETVMPSLVIISRGNRPNSSSRLRFLCFKPKEKFLLTWVTILFRPEFLLNSFLGTYSGGLPTTTITTTKTSRTCSYSNNHDQLRHATGVITQDLSTLAY